MNAPPKPISQAKAATSERKKRETAIHRVIDGYRKSVNGDECMEEIMRILKRREG